MTQEEVTEGAVLSDEELNALCATEVMDWHIHRIIVNDSVRVEGYCKCDGQLDKEEYHEPKAIHTMAIVDCLAVVDRLIGHDGWSPLTNSTHLDMLVDHMVNELLWGYSFTCSHWHVDWSGESETGRVLMHEAQFVNGPGPLNAEGKKTARSGPKVTDKDKRRAWVLAALRAVGGIE